MEGKGPLRAPRTARLRGPCCPTAPRADSPSRPPQAVQDPMEPAPDVRPPSPDLREWMPEQHRPLRPLRPLRRPLRPQKPRLRRSRKTPDHSHLSRRREVNQNLVSTVSRGGTASGTGTGTAGAGAADGIADENATTVVVTEMTAAIAGTAASGDSGCSGSPR